MKFINTKVTAMASAVSLAVTASVSMANGPGGGSEPYEIWGSDQSNSVRDVGSRGVNGSYMWIWDGKDVGNQIKKGTPAQPLGCDGSNTPGDGPCDLNVVFPGNLQESEDDGQTTTGETLASVGSFGRLHGMLPDPQGLYQNVNSFVTGSNPGGYVGIVDARTKEAVALFRVTKTNAASGGGRSLHMSFWNKDGSALLLANLHGRILERIDITRDADGNITDAVYNRSASLNVGKTGDIGGILDSASVFLGTNAQGSDMIGSVVGSYANADLGNLTPDGYCREDGCTDAGAKPSTGRGVNVIICPIVSDNGNTYITMGGGGLLVADSTATPMSLVAEYDRATVNGAGCGGVEDDNGTVWLNAGVSASGAGATQSTFSMYAIDDNAISAGVAGGGVNAMNTPAPNTVFKDVGNTMTIGNDFGPASNGTGQLPGETTRRDAHGAVITNDKRYVHNVDRIQNNVEVFDTASQAHVGTYDLTSANGQGGGMGPCAAASVNDDPYLPGNDVAPDLMDATPDGKYLVVALRGPTPVSVTHSAQGSCPGVGVIQLRQGGKSGKLLTVLRSTNTVDNAPVSAPGGYPYAGAERSDVHGASVISKKNW